LFGFEEVDFFAEEMVCLPEEMDFFAEEMVCLPEEVSLSL
jgi:hypothetical protein